MSLNEGGQLQRIHHHRHELWGQGAPCSSSSAGVVVVVAGREGVEGDLVDLYQVVLGVLFAAEHLLAQAAGDLRGAHLRRCGGLGDKGKTRFC